MVDTAPEASVPTADIDNTVAPLVETVTDTVAPIVETVTETIDPVVETRTDRHPETTAPIVATVAPVVETVTETRPRSSRRSTRSSRPSPSRP